MQRLFGILAVVLAAAAVFTYLTEPDLRSDVPVIYWATDPNPARVEQIRLFHEWLVKHGHTTPAGKPVVELRLDTASQGGNKKIIQSVSGVAADIMDCPVPAFQRLGVLEDVTAQAAAQGFDLGHTYAALEPNITVDGRQYGFPCNVNLVGYWVNVETFKRYGLEPPPRQWDFETFERIGKQFVAAANPAGERRTVFFCNSAADWTGDRLMNVMHRSLGLGVYNETMTRCTLDDERFARVMGLLHKWTYTDHIMPSAADEASFASESGYGGSTLSLFQAGNYGMICIGRWCLIRIREFASPPRLSVSYLPFESFANGLIDARCAAVYRGSPHRDLAVLFLAFLASEDYNRNVILDADALPPSPEFTHSEAYLRPSDHRNEWGCHEIPVEGTQRFGIGFEFSPFVPYATAARYRRQALEKVMSDLATPADAAAEAARRIDEEIALTLRESPTLRARYQELVERQQEIESRRQAGKLVPLSWITNPFHRRYYLAQGWATRNEDAAGERSEP